MPRRIFNRPGMVAAGIIGLAFLASAAAAEEVEPVPEPPENGDDDDDDYEPSPDYYYEESTSATELTLHTNSQSGPMHYRIESVGEIERGDNLMDHDEVFQDGDLWVAEGQFGPAGTDTYHVYATGLEFFGLWDLDTSTDPWTYTDTPTPVNEYDVSWGGSAPDPRDISGENDVADADDTAPPDPDPGDAGPRTGQYDGVLGGGSGMPSQLVYSASDADYTVSSGSQLQSAINSSSSGDVIYVQGSISGSPHVNQAGITIVGNRGHGNDGRINLNGRLRISASGVELNGLRLDRGRPTDGSARVVRVEARDVLIENCEIFNAGYAGVEEPLANARLTLRYCHIHDCRSGGLGYGWQGHYNWTSSGNETIIEMCRFDTNRRHCSGAYAYYIARDNEFGPQRHGSPNHACEVRAQTQAAGNSAGNAVIEHNDVRGGQRVAVARGVPTDGMWVEYNRTDSSMTPTDRGTCANSSGSWGSGCSILQPFSGTGSWDNVFFEGNEWNSL